MKAALAALIAACVCACTAPLEDVPAPRSAAVPAPNHADSNAVIVEYLEIKLAVELPEPPPVEWYEGIWMRAPDRDKLCMFYAGDDHCYEGRYFAPDRYEREVIHLSAYDDVLDTDRVHQLTHWALWHATGDTDDLHCHIVWGIHEADPSCF